MLPIVLGPEAGTEINVSRLARRKSTQNRDRAGSAPSPKTTPGNLPNRTYNQQLGGVSQARARFHLCEVLLSGSQTFHFELLVLPVNGSPAAQLELSWLKPGSWPPNDSEASDTAL